ncbi:MULTISPECIES: VPLPA-CTERM sorting domain-containing protein [unclassified Methylophaga]|uniref:VPLPA-CTERM sorting domain-containing protein n=1 Tax=unclassified Methylophaga TaxID=2629249 RepID=UPI00259D27ED|nr:MULTISPECIES: VPLPA-CTERM sorting domain-containing protein [unclassified Methylophaga]
MKSLFVFAILLIFSSSSLADSYFMTLKGGRGYAESYYTYNTDTGHRGEGSKNPYQYYDSSVGDEEIEDTDDFFYLGDGHYVLRWMGTWTTFAALEDVSGTILVQWQTFETQNTVLGYFGQILELPETGYGYLLLDIDLMQYDTFSMLIEGDAKSLRSQMEYSFGIFDGTIPEGPLFDPNIQAVPLPNTAWLLLPALIGVVGFRRRHS